VLISRGTGRLNDKNIVAPDVFLDPDVSLAIGEGANSGLAKRNPDVCANPLGQRPIGGAAENFQLWLEREHGAANLGVRKRPWQSSKLANDHFFDE
jgi:hypothetical protein